MTVEPYHDVFPPICPDETWLRHVGEKGRVAITHDGRIRYKPNELAAVMRHSVALLVVVGKAPYSVLARNFVTTMPRIKEFLARHQAPFIGKVYRPSPSESTRDPSALGSVSLWYPR